MATRIFETDPDSQPKQRQSFKRPDIDLIFRSGMQRPNPATGKMEPTTIPEWRVTTGDPEIADKVSELYGGAPEEWDTPKDDCLQVLTNAKAVPIVVSGSDAIEDRLILWGRQGPIHECDGMYFLSPEEDAGQPCKCPSLLADRKAQSRNGRGPAPHVSLTFRLADDYDLGVAKFTSTSWDLLVSLHSVRNALDNIDGEALCSLSIELVEYTTKAGRDVRYFKPVISPISSWSDAISE